MPDNIENSPEDKPDEPQNPMESENPSGSARSEQANHGEVLPRPEAAEPANQGSLSYESYRGLLPHPAHLERFEQLAPGAAERFMEWVEVRAAHQREIEKQELEQDFLLQREHLQQQTELRRETMRTELAQTKLETATQSRVAMAAHTVAFSLVVAGFVLFFLGKDGGAVAFGAVGVIYTSGTIAGIFRRDGGKSKEEKSDSSEIEKSD